MAKVTSFDLSSDLFPTLKKGGLGDLNLGSTRQFCSSLGLCNIR